MIRTLQDIVIPAGTVFIPFEGRYITIIADGDSEMTIEITEDNVLEFPETYQHYEPQR